MNKDIGKVWIRVVDSMFPEPLANARAKQILSAYGAEAHHREIGRVRLAILRLAWEEPEKLSHFTNAACGDYRDVLAWAEYPLTFRDHQLRETHPEKYRSLGERELSEYKMWLDRALRG